MSNTIHVFGKVMQDPELRYTPAGKPVVNLNIGDSRKIKDKETGEAAYENTYFKATCWDATAEFVNNHFRKGDWVHVSGQLTPTIRVWEASDGTHKASYELSRVHNIEKAWNDNSAPKADDEDEHVPF